MAENASSSTPPNPGPTKPGGSGDADKTDEFFDTIAGGFDSMKEELEYYKGAVREYIRACEMASHTHDQHKRREFLRMMAGKAMGWNPYLFGDIPFPGASITRSEVNNYPSPPAGPSVPQPPMALPVAPGMSTLGKVLLGGALALGGAGIGAGVVALLNRPASEEIWESKNGAPFQRILPNPPGGP